MTARPLSSFPVVLFDAGETLIGPRESFGAVYARVSAEMGLDRPVEAFDRAIRGSWEALNRSLPRGADRYAHFPGGESAYWRHFVRGTFERIAPEPACDLTLLASRAVEPLRNAFRDPRNWEVFADVFPVLEELKADGTRMGIVSNWDSRLQALLERLRLAPYFETVVVSHLEGIEKPAPEIFYRALERLGARPGDTLHVGDTPDLDLAGAEAAGLAAVLVDRRRRVDRALAPLSDLTPLPKIVREGKGSRHFTRRFDV